MTPTSLYELGCLVREAVALHLPESLWLAAELSELRVGQGGHCYVEFVEKEEKSGKLRAKARGNIWRDTYALLAPYFEQQTGMPLAPGLKVLVEVGVDFHPLYGYALTVRDIEPSYTLGAVAQRRKEILDRLEEEGVLGLNRELPLPRPMLRLAIISSPTAAGFGDFCDQLDGSGIAFRYELFPAIMQGEAVELSIIASLNAIAKRREDFDLVVIIRGGGATSDLNGFESYELAANVAQFPLPVLTGIGHERDDTVIDFVAHTRLKTPTAVAAFLVESAQCELAQVEALSSRLNVAAGRLLAEKKSSFALLVQRLRSSVSLGFSREKARIETLAGLRLQTALQLRMEREKHRVDAALRSIRMASPERILKLGYTLTSLNGKIVTQAADLKPGDVLATRFSDGEILSEVK